MSNPIIKKWADFFERVVWTAVQAFAATALVTGFDDWELTFKASGVAALIAALKVIAGQHIGNDTGAIPST